MPRSLRFGVDEPALTGFVFACGRSGRTPSSALIARSNRSFSDFNSATIPLMSNSFLLLVTKTIRYVGQFLRDAEILVELRRRLAPSSQICWL
jgi:hypothetical protein